MRLSNERIKQLQALLEQQLGLKYTDEEAQQAGLAIVRFVLAKEQRARKLISKPKDKNT